jgi:hypothetical protein
MGSDKICTKKQVPDCGPQHFESWLSSNVFPGDSVYRREEEGVSRWADQVIFPLNDASAGDANETDRTSAIGTVVGRLEIDCHESHGAYHADWGTITLSRAAGPPVDERCSST